MKVDRAVLMEAFRNLVENAVQSMPNGGKLEITTERNEDFVDALHSRTPAMVSLLRSSTVVCNSISQPGNRELVWAYRCSEGPLISMVEP